MNSTLKILTICFAIITSTQVQAQEPAPQITSLAELVAYDSGIATYSVTVCDEAQSQVFADIVFSNVQAEFALAEIKILVSKDRGMCAGGRKQIQFNVKQLLALKAQEKGITSLSVLLKSLPNRIELLQR